MLAIGVLRTPRAVAAVEPALAAGITVVIGYGLAGRLLPGIVELSRSRGAGGRLEQPITYWNAEGALAAVGLRARAPASPATAAAPRGCAPLAAAAAAPLGAGVYLSFSRGAIAAALLGLVVLAALAPARAQLRAAAAALAARHRGRALCGRVLPGVAALEGAPATGRARARSCSPCSRCSAAAAALASLRGRAGAATTRRRLGAPAAAGRGRCRRARRSSGSSIGGPGRAAERRPSSRAARTPGGSGPSARTATSTGESGCAAFAREPLTGPGRGGLPRRMAARARLRRSGQGRALARARDGGRARARRPARARAARRRGRPGRAHRARATTRGGRGAAAAALAWLLHASIDWDWQFPAVALPAIVARRSAVALSETAR